MNIETPRLHGIWPSESEVLLLRAALARDSTAVALWERWYRTYDLDRLSSGCFRLLPLVCRTLGREGYEGPEMAKLRGAYRQSWYRNRLLFRHSANVLRDLTELGIPHAVLKGIPVAIRTYRDHGARSMGDGDILVPSECVDAAVERLRATGWTPVSPVERFTDLRHAIGFENRGGLQIDLHWFLFKDHLYSGSVRGPWKEMPVFVLDGVATRAMDPGDRLLHTIAHGLNWEHELPIRWIPDAVLTLRRHAGELDWDHILAAAGELELTLQLREALTYLEHTFVDSGVPGAALAALSARRASVSERMEHWFRMRAGPQYLWGMFPATWFRYRRRAKARGQVPNPVSFALFVRRLWTATEQRALVAGIANRVRRRLRWYAVARRHRRESAPPLHGSG